MKEYEIKAKKLIEEIKNRYPMNSTNITIRKKIENIESLKKIYNDLEIELKELSNKHLTENPNIKSKDIQNINTRLINENISI